MKRRKIACLSIALIITTLLTGCSLGDIPVVGKLFDKGEDIEAEAPADSQDITDDTSGTDTPSIDAEYPPVPVGTVITVNDIFNILSSAGLSTETVAGYLILDANGSEVMELTVTEDTYFTFIYQMRDADPSEQSKLVIGVRVTDEVASDTGSDEQDVVSTPDSTSTDGVVETEQPSTPVAAKYEVFNFDECGVELFSYTAELTDGKLYKASVLDFDISKVLHIDGYTGILKQLSELTTNYTDVTLSNDMKVYCIPKSYLYMQAPDYEEGADMSAYNGEYVLVIKPIYNDDTNEIYQSEDVIIMPLIEDVNAFAKEPSDAAKSECDFLMDESYDDDSNEIPDFYGAMEILLQLSSTDSLFIFDDLLKYKTVEYSDMGTPDDMTDDVTWEEYEAGLLSGEQTGGSTGEQGSESSTAVSSGSTTITETTTTTEGSIAEAITEDVKNTFRSRHPELFSFFPDTEQVYSKWDWRIDNNTTVKGTVTLKDGTIIPQLESSDGGSIYKFADGSATATDPIGGQSGSSSESGSVFGSGSSTSGEGSLTVGDEGYTTAEPDEDEDEDSKDDDILEYEISLGNTKCKVTSNNTYRYMIDGQNSSSSEVFINYRDKRYTIKVVDGDQYMNYWTKDYLSRSLNGYSIVSNSYTGSTVADNTAISLMDIQYESSGQLITQPYMAYIRNGDEYIIIIPEKAEEEGSVTLPDILKRCVAIQ